MDELCNDDEYAMHCNECIDNNPLLKFFFLTSFIPFTVFFSMWVVAKFVYEPSINNTIEEEEEIFIPYEEKYPIKEHLSKDNININNFVFENTPNGTVFMRYNKENEDFEYWCDDKQIPYKYLETVSRKFVNYFQCQNLYIDRKKEIELQKTRKKELLESKKKKEDEKEEAEEENSVFAKLKPKVETESKVKNIDVDVAVRGNKYKYMSKIKDFTFIPERKKEEAKKLSFNEWKKSSWF